MLSDDVVRILTAASMQIIIQTLLKYSDDTKFAVPSRQLNPLLESPVFLRFFTLNLMIAAVKLGGTLEQLSEKKCTVTGRTHEKKLLEFSAGPLAVIQFLEICPKVIKCYFSFAGTFSWPIF